LLLYGQRKRGLWGGDFGWNKKKNKKKKQRDTTGKKEEKKKQGKVKNYWGKSKKTKETQLFGICLSWKKLNLRIPLEKKNERILNAGMRKPIAGAPLFFAINWMD